MQALGYLYYLTNRLGWVSKDRGPRHGRIGGAGQAARRALATLRLWRARRAAIRELDGLSDRILRDIGLNRADIRTTVNASIRAEKQDNDLDPCRAGARLGLPDESFKVVGCG